MENLIYTDETLNDIGYATAFSLELENGKVDNSFTFQVALTDFKKYAPGSYIYCENAPQYGGAISAYIPNTANQTVTFEGRTWRGMFARKYFLRSVTIPKGTTLDSAINTLINELNFSESFEAAANGQTISSSYTVLIYGNALTELETMLSAFNCRPSFIFDPISKKIKIGSEAIQDYSEDEFDSDKIDLEIYVNTMPINHVVGVLESGSQRHRYLLHDGTQSETTQEIKGAAEVISVIEISGTTDPSEAMKAVIDESLAASQTCAITVNSLDADIGDIVGGRENETGVFVKSKITSKILKMTEFTSIVNFETGA